MKKYKLLVYKYKKNVELAQKGKYLEKEIKHWVCILSWKSVRTLWTRIMNAVRSWRLTKSPAKDDTKVSPWNSWTGNRIHMEFCKALFLIEFQQLRCNQPWEKCATIVVHKRIVSKMRDFFTQSKRLQDHICLPTQGNKKIKREEGTVRKVSSVMQEKIERIIKIFKQHNSVLYSDYTFIT